MIRKKKFKLPKPRRNVYEEVKTLNIIFEGLVIMYEDFMAEVEPHKKSEYLDEIRKSMSEFNKLYGNINSYFLEELKTGHVDVDLRNKAESIHKDYKKLFNKR